MSGALYCKQEIESEYYSRKHIASRQENKMLQANMTTSTSKSPMSGDLMSVINQCYQCGKCSAGCPVASEMDLMPHQLVRLAVLGEVDKIVASKSIWLCLTCHTCGARCPNGIDVPALLDPIRHNILRSKAMVTDPKVAIFHKTFMDTVKRFGRVYELFLVGMYKFRTKTFTDDMELGWNMFRKGKLHLLPQKTGNLSEVKEVFRKSAMK
jgi:heterodisulfide reductase subunit C